MKLAPWRRGKGERSVKNQFWLRVFWTLLIIGTSGAYAVIFKTELVGWILAPAEGKLSPSIPGFDGKPIYTTPTGSLMATVDIVIRTSLVCTLPYLAYATLSFIKPWIWKSLWKFLTLLIISVGIALVLSFLFVYYVMLGVGLGFLLDFDSENAVALVEIGEYLGLMYALIRAMVFVFLVPIFMFLLTKVLGFPKYKHWKWFRWGVPIFATLMGIFLTPTADSMNFLMVGVPVVLLYEVGLFSVWLTDTSQGNYMWFGSLMRLVRKVWGNIIWVALRPTVLYRKVVRKLVRMGLISWA